MNKHKDFLRSIVEEDLKSGKYKKIVTRFPPEPNGFPHIGHAKSICINFGIAKEYNGHCNLRMDDTNPTTEDTLYVEALKDAVKWLGFEWNSPVRFTSDYFPRLYDYALALIKMGKAYVDSLNEEEIRQYRGTLTQAGKRSKYADRSTEENMELFERMKNGEFKDGEHVLRAKIDMSAANMKMRDPLLYRIRHAHHFRTEDKWAIYPMYDFAHCLSDYIEGVSHSICTLEFENNRDIYDWILDTLALKKPRPYQHEFARLSINYTVMSKRKLLDLVEKNIVNGWDDPRLPTIAGLRRRGYTPQSIVNFCDDIGVAKSNSVVDIAQLEHHIRDDLNTKVPRAMCVLDPLKITLVNYKGSEEIEAPYYPPDIPKNGSRIVPFSKNIYIDRADFSQISAKEYFRLTPTQPVRLKYAYIISCQEIIKDKNGNITEIKAIYHPDSKSGEDKSGIKVKSAIHWVDGASAKPVEVRIYDRLFKTEMPQGAEDINPCSLKVIKNALIEPAVINDMPDTRFQFEREGYFYADPIEYKESSPVFNKIVGLKVSSSKKKKTAYQKPKSQIKKVQIDGKETPMSRQEQIRYEHYIKNLKLKSEVANTIARDEKLAQFFKEALESYHLPAGIANIVSNEIAKDIKHKNKISKNMTPQKIATLVKMVEDGTISNKIAKEVIEEMNKNGGDPIEIVNKRGLIQISDPSKILPFIDDVVSKNPKNVEKFKAGNQKLLGFFIGEVLKATQGKANPKIVDKLVKKALNG